MSISFIELLNGYTVEEILSLLQEAEQNLSLAKGHTNPLVEEEARKELLEIGAAYEFKRPPSKI
jgi:hypothetical protein